MNRQEFDRLLRERVLIFDGATGTNLQLHNPTADDYAGLEGCTEILLDTHPDWIEQLHASFFEVGCHVVETNSFGANRIVRGPAITHPFGMDEAERRRIVERALELLETDVEPNTVWMLSTHRRLG